MNCARRRGGVSWPGCRNIRHQPALAISRIELINQWCNNPDYLAMMRNCNYPLIGAWPENRLDCTAVVAGYGSPA